DNSREGLALFRPDLSPGPSLGGSAEGAGGAAAATRYVDTSEGAGLYQPSFLYLTFGTMFCDVDLDGRKDLVTANGHVNDAIEKDGVGVTYAERMQLFHNEGRGRYVDVSRSAGPAFQDAIVGRGLAV